MSLTLLALLVLINGLRVIADIFKIKAMQGDD
jgi:hypothetical protein